MKTLTTLLALSSALAISGCVSPTGMMKMKPGEAVTVLKTNVTMDGNPEGGTFGTTCFIGMVGPDGKPAKFYKDTSSNYYIIKTKAGKTEIKGFGCMAYKVLYNKTRNFQLEGLSFETTEGQFNYPGDIKVDWESSRFNVTDLFNGMTMLNDKGPVQLRAISNVEAARAFLMSQDPSATSITVKEVTLSDHPLLTK